MANRHTNFERPPVILFGYDSSPFTQKVRLALRLKQIPYTFVIVSSMLPRPLLKENFNLNYRKIPVLAIGSDVYIDTSIILEALEQQFTSQDGYGTLYPPTPDGRPIRPLVRGFLSYWTDRPLFRVTTGLIPPAVWRTNFGKDRSDLIGSKIDPNKLEKKIPENLSGLDMHLSMLEPLLADTTEEYPWLFSTRSPSAADIGLFYQLDWGEKISRGAGIENLTGGGTANGSGEGTTAVFSRQRYPNITVWFLRTKKYFENLPNLEERVERDDEDAAASVIANIQYKQKTSTVPLLKTGADQQESLDHRNGLINGSKVAVTPEDTGKGYPTTGELLALSPEEIVIIPDPINGKPSRVKNVRLHFPRLGFVVRPATSTTERANL